MPTPASRLLAGLISVLGSAAILAGLALNPWSVEAWLVRDGTFDNKSALLALNAAAIVIGIILLFQARRIRASAIDDRSLRLGFTAALLAAVVAVGCAELAVRIALPAQLLYLPDESNWWILRWQAAQREAAADKLTPEGFGFDRYDLVLGWSPTPDFRSPDIRTNSQGIRADHDYALTPDPGVFRIVIIGDSFTWGEDVADPYTYPAQLEKLLPRTEVINLGVHGYGTDQQLIRLRESGMAFKPDLVILGFYEGNMDRNVLAFRDFGKPHFELIDGALQVRNQPVPTRDEYLALEVPLPAFRLGKLAGRVWETGIRATTLHPPLSEWPRWQLTSSIFSAAKVTAAAEGAEFLLVHIGDSESIRTTELETTLERWTAASGMHYVNLSDIFRARPADEWERIYQGHLTNYGNGVAAAAIADYLDRAGLVPAAVSP